MAQLNSLIVTGDSRFLNTINGNITTANGIHRATMNSSSTATAFILTADGIDSLYDGLIITCKNTKIKSASGCTINLNGLGAKSIWLAQSNSACTTHWNLNETYMFIYDSTNSRWELQQGRDTNSDTYDRNRYNANILCGSTAIVAGNIIVADSANKYKHLKLGTAFDIQNPILYAGSAIAANATGTNNYDCINFTVTTTQSITLTVYAPVYIKGTLAGSIFTPISTTPLTQTKPTSADGYHYMLLGVANSTTAIYLTEDHRIFSYRGGAFRENIDDGNGTKSPGYYAHTEGGSTCATGSYTHAEGASTSAVGYGSHTEGSNTRALDSYAHAEGANTCAVGNSSHTEGSNTWASGQSAHAEGSVTCAIGNSAHTEGSSTTATGSSAHAEGTGTYAAGSYAHAEGYMTTAKNSYTHAEGSGTLADSGYAHAEGHGTTSVGESSHAEGSHTYASGTMGNHAEGLYSSATGYVSHAEGLSTKATGTNGSHAEGNNTTCSGGYGAHAEGNHTCAAGDSAHAEGYQTTAKGSHSHAEGLYTYAFDDESHAEGYQTTAGSHGHAEGQLTYASTNSHAEGSHTCASGNTSHSEGYYTYALGNYSHAEGSYATASGMLSHSEGYFTSAAGDYQHVQGKYNIANANMAYIIGGGTNAFNKKNIFTVDWNGNVTATGRSKSEIFNEILTGTGTAAQDKGSGVSPRYFPAKWTFNTGLTATDGDIVTIKIPVAGHDYGIFMTIDNGINYYPVVGTGNGRITTHYPINTYITVVFEPSGSAASVYPVNGGNSRVTASNGAWRVVNYYADGNDVTTLRSYYSRPTAGGNGVKQYSLFARMLDGANTVYSSFTTGNGTGTKTFDTTHYFDIRKIYYHNNSGNIASGSVLANATMSINENLVDGRYTFNSITTSAGFTANKPLYVVFDKSSPSYNCYKIKSPYWTHTPNDTNAIYVLVGFTYDTYRFSLLAETLAFEYKDSKLVPYGTGGGGGDADLYSNCHVIVDTTMLTSGAALRVRSTTDSTKVWNATVTAVGTPVIFDVPCYDRYYACIVSNNEEMAKAFFNADYGQTVYIGNLGNKYSLEGIQTILDAHKEVDMINIGDEVSISIDGTDTIFLVAAINLYNDHEIIFSAKYAYDSCGWSNSSSAQESYPSTYYQIMQHVESIYSAIDGSDKNLIKTTDKICRKPYDNNTWTSFTAHFWLPNSHELDGIDAVSSKGLKQFPLYLTAQNRIRSLVNGSANWWYTCDGCKVSVAIQSVAASGALDHLSPNSPRLIVPHFRMTANV